MHKGQWFVNRLTGRRVRIVESITVRSGNIETMRWRLSDSTVYLDERQVKAAYDEVETQPA